MAARYFVTILIAFQVILLAWGAVRHSPTYDEVAHLPAGLSHWELGDYRLFRVNPPLVRMVAALPALLLGAETDWGQLESVIHSGSDKRVDFDVGREFIAANGERSFWLYTIARWACIPFVLLGGWVAWRWSRELYGEGSGVLAVAVWCLSPMVLGHGQLITPDVAAASLGTLAFYLFWRWTQKSNWAAAYLAGLALGLAELTKTTWIVAVPLMIVLWGGLVMPRGGQGWRQGAQLLFIFALAWLVFVLGYTGDGLFKPLGEYKFQSRALAGDGQGGEEVIESEAESGSGGNRFAGTWLAGIPVPLPEQYVHGFDVQKANFESTTLSYLRGELRSRGWWYYYLYGVGVKSTVGVLLLLVVVTSVRAGRVIAPIRRPKADACVRMDEWFVLLPLCTLVILVSSQTGINKHLRYLLPAYPFAIIWISQAVRLADDANFARRRIFRSAIVACVVWGTVSSLWIYPHSMSYFNELAGGPRRGDRHLINSNIEWGQDLFYLRDKIDRLGWDEVGMVYWGRYDARLGGIVFHLPSRGPLENVSKKRGRSRLLLEPGRYAISINQLHGYAFVAPDGEGGLVMPRRDAYRYFQRWEPVDSAGYSMRLYEVGENDVRDLRQQLGWNGLPTIELKMQWELAPGRNAPRVVTAVPGNDQYLVGYADGSVSRVDPSRVFQSQRSGSGGNDTILGTKLVRPTETRIEAITCSPVGDRFATGHSDGQVFVAPVAPVRDEASVVHLGSQTARVNAIAFSPDGVKLASTGDDGLVWVWDVGESALVGTFDCGLPVTALDWLSSNELVIGTGDWRTSRRGSIQRYDITGRRLAQMTDSHHFIIDLVTTADGQVIGRGSSGELSIWNGTTGEKHFTFVGEQIRPLALSNDGRWLAGGDSRGMVWLWELATGDLVYASQEFDHGIADVAFIGINPLLITVDNHGWMREFSIVEKSIEE